MQASQAWQHTEYCHPCRGTAGSDLTWGWEHLVPGSARCARVHAGGRGRVHHAAGVGAARHAARSHQEAARRRPVRPAHVRHHLRLLRRPCAPSQAHISYCSPAYIHLLAPIKSSMYCTCRNMKKSVIYPEIQDFAGLNDGFNSGIFHSTQHSSSRRGGWQCEGSPGTMGMNGWPGTNCCCTAH